MKCDKNARFFFKFEFQNYLRKYVRLLIAGAICLGATACASDQNGYLLALDDTSKVQKTRTVLAVTTRTPADASKRGEFFTGERGWELRYLSLTLSMPPTALLAPYRRIRKSLTLKSTLPWYPPRN